MRRRSFSGASTSSNESTSSEERATTGWLRFMFEGARHILTTVILSSLLILLLKEPRKVRSCQTLPRFQGGWDFEENHHTAAQFRKDYRMSRRTFDYIFDKIQDGITVACLPCHIMVEKRRKLACVIFRLANGCSLSALEKCYGMSPSGIVQASDEIWGLIIDRMWKEEVDSLYPKSHEAFMAAAADMDKEWQFPGAFACLDGSHIPIKVPPGGAESRKEYYNFKGWYSVILVAMCDARKRIIWAVTGMPGSTGDSSIFEATRKYNDILNQNDLPESPAFKIGNIEIPYMILGDGGFKHFAWLQKPFSRAARTIIDKYFNKRLSRARMNIEATFALLKSRFRFLYKQNESSVDTINKGTMCAIVLHNLCLRFGDVIARARSLRYDARGGRRRRSEIRDLIAINSDRSYRYTASALPATRVRNALRDMFWEERSASVRQNEQNITSDPETDYDSDPDPSEPINVGRVDNGVVSDTSDQELPQQLSD